MDSAISLAPIMDQVVLPVVGILAMSLTTAFVGWWATNVHRWTGKEMTDANKKSLQDAIDSAGKVIFAGASAGISTLSIKPSDNAVLNQTSRIIGTMPDIIKKLGITPDSIAHEITGVIGGLQAQSTATAATNQTVIMPPANSTTVATKDIVAIDAPHTAP